LAKWPMEFGKIYYGKQDM